MTEKCRVLIVEDELITRQALRYILSQNQDKYCIVGEALNGKDAQELIEREKPHVVICDIVMPVMDGIELTKWIQLRYAHIYIVILSSYGNFEYVKSSFQYGASGFTSFFKITAPLLKPIILFTTILSTNGNLQLFDEVVNLTNGGPANATITISQYIYNLCFKYTPDFGYASAVSYSIVIMVAVLSFLSFLFYG